jgi:hypothetical protein
LEKAPRIDCYKGYKARVIRKLCNSEGLSPENIQTTAQETEQKAAEMMKTYLGDDPDSSEAIDFCALQKVGSNIL